jgi:hypothetical protein
MSSLLRPALRLRAPLPIRSFSSTRASQLARMTVIGRLGASPEEHALPSGGERTSYGKGEKQKTSWFRVASFVEGAQKEFLMGVPKG